MPDLIKVLEQLPARQLPEKDRRLSRLTAVVDTRDVSFELLVGADEARRRTQTARSPQSTSTARSPQQDDTFELVIGDEVAESRSRSSSSDSDTSTSMGAGADSELPEPGHQVIVDREFLSDSQDRVLVPRFSRGTVVEVDEDGDALVDFAGIGLQWVKKKRFPKRVVAHGGNEQDDRQAADIRQGCLVQVARPLVTASERSRVLRSGMVGVVEEVDGDGDALIKFEGLDGFEWISQADFGKLRAATPSA